MGGFAPEEVVAETDVRQNHRQHDDRADQQQGLGFGRSRRLTEGDLEGHDIGPGADRNAEIAGQKNTEAQ